MNRKKRVQLDIGDFYSVHRHVVWFQGKIFPSHPGFGFYMYGAAAAAAAAAAGGGDVGGGSETSYPPPAHMGIQPLYVDSKTAGKLSSKAIRANDYADSAIFIDGESFMSLCDVKTTSPEIALNFIGERPARSSSFTVLNKRPL